MDKLKTQKDKYILFDTPGQVELTTHHNGLRNIVRLLSKDIRLCGVHMVDLSYCLDGGKWIGGLVYGLMSMLQLELPTIGVLSKVDLMRGFGSLGIYDLKIDFPLEYYTQVQDLSHLNSLLDSKISAKYAGLTSALSELISDFNLVSFQPLCITDKTSMMKLLILIDKASGYCYQNLDNTNMFESVEKWNCWESESRRVAEVYGNNLEFGEEGNDGGFEDEHPKYNALVGNIKER
jgi:hypothetical protein